MVPGYTARVRGLLICAFILLALLYVLLNRTRVLGEGPVNQADSSQIYLPLITVSGQRTGDTGPSAMLTTSGPIFLSLANSGAYTVGVVSGVQDEDIITFDGTNFGMLFDGTDVGVGRLDLDAFTIVDSNTILMSFDNLGTVGSLGQVDDADIVRFDATSLGDKTAGTFSLFFDGSAVGLEADNNNEDIDAAELLPDGRLLLSTTGNITVTGLSGGDEDLLAFTPTSPDNYNSGSWAMYFDGSDVKLNTHASED